MWIEIRRKKKPVLKYPYCNVPVYFLKDLYLFTEVRFYLFVTVLVLNNKCGLNISPRHTLLFLQHHCGTSLHGELVSSTPCLMQVWFVCKGRWDSEMMWLSLRRKPIWQLKFVIILFNLKWATLPKCPEVDKVITCRDLPCGCVCHTCHARCTVLAFRTALD